VQATEQLSRLVIETASQRPATQKDFRTQELAIEMQTRRLVLCKIQHIGSLQAEITTKFCRFQIREEGAKLNSATQNAIRYAREMLAQAETKTKVQFANRNGKKDKSDGSDTQVAKVKKDLTLQQREIAKLKNPLHQVKKNMAKERAERSSKSKKEDSQEDEVGSKRVSQQAKRAKASRPGPSPLSPTRKGFKMLPTSNSEEEEVYPKQNVQATYAKAKCASIQPITQRQTGQVEIEPKLSSVHISV
jgi:hypothetical protein